MLSRSLLGIFLLFSYTSFTQTTQLSIGTPALSEIFSDCKIDPSGGTIHVGIITNTATGTDIFMVKLDAANQIVWQKVVTNAGNDYAYDVLICANGDYIVTGELVQSGLVRGFTSRVNSTNGNIFWTYTSTATGSPNGDKLYNAVETTSGNIAVAGVSDFASGQTNSFVVLLNSSGILLWSRVSGFSLSDEFYAINQLPNGNLIITGFYNAGTFYNLTVFEMDESSASIIAQNHYSISTTIPGVPLTLNSMGLNNIFIRNNAVVITGIIFQNFTSASYPVEYVYDQTTKNLSGNICYHPGATTTPGAYIYPLSAQDFLISYYSPSSASPFFSRVTNNVIIYDRQINGTTTTLASIDVDNNNLLLTGWVNGANFNGYKLASTISLPLSTTPCSVTAANTLVLQPSNLTAVVGTSVTLNATNPVSSVTLTAANTSYTPNMICTCLLINVSAHPTDATLCAGGTASFNITAVNNSTYQWQESINGGANWNNVTNGGVYGGATTATLTLIGITAGMNNYQYRCVLTSACDNSTSNPATLFVTPAVTPTISITGSANPVCTGTAVTFTATITNGGTTPVYQWTKNSINVGTNSPTYTDNTLANGDVISCMLTSNASCLTSNTANSNNITMTVSGQLTPLVAIDASSNPVCTAMPVTFTATPTNGGSSPVYQWAKNAVIAGTNSSVYTDNALVNGDVIICTLTSSESCAVPTTATSNSITMTVTASVTTSVNIVASANSICAGIPVTFTAAPTNGGAAPVYQWTKNSMNVGTNSTIYTDNALANNDVVRCVLTSNANCVTVNPATSNSITMIVTPSVTASVTITASGNSTCTGTPVTFTATPANGGTTPVYQWMKNSVNVGTNSPTYSDNALANGDVIRCTLTSNANCATGNPATSNSITMFVSGPVTPSVNIVASANPICAGTTVVLTATPVNGGPAPVYQWKKNGMNVGANNAIYTDNSIINGDMITCEMTSNAACVTVANVTSNSITMSVTGSSIPSTRYPALTAYVNRPLQLQALTLGGNNYTWQPSIGLNNSMIIDPVFNYNQQQQIEYTISISVPGGCNVIDTQLVKVEQNFKDIIVPSAFSPDGNGLNDVLYPILFGINKLNYFRVYNRWGNLVFTTTIAGFANGWNGEYKTKKQPQESYTWVAEGVAYDGEIIQRWGNTILIR